MSDITVIGLGLMGAALARAIQRAGHGMTVWNRTPEKMQPFIADGVPAAPDLATAVEASPVVLVCIDNYAATNAALREPAIAPLLRGRNVVQLSTGTPREARESAEWTRASGVSYLDGAILAGPNDIGTDDAIILLSGEQATHGRVAGLLQCLGGEVRYLGDNVGAASALDLAWLCDSYGRFLAVTHAARICESEGVGVDEFAALFGARSLVRRYASVIHAGSYDQRTATLAVWGAALERIRSQGRDAGIDTGFPDFTARLFGQAMAAGHGDEHVMALVKVLRGGAQS